MHKETKAKSISPEVKRAVYERDNGECIFCHAPGEPVAHFISRGQGGLGVEENILTVCHKCHRRLDQSERRVHYKALAAIYLKSKYPKWNPKKLIYRKDEIE